MLLPKALRTSWDRRQLRVNWNGRSHVAADVRNEAHQGGDNSPQQRTRSPMK